MGNRCVITTEQKKIGVYLHWNGGHDSVTAFLTYCKLKGFRTPESDCYGWSRLCQVIGNFLGGGLSIGIDTFDSFCGDEDNGTFIIKNWEIIGKDSIFHQSNHNLVDMLEAINEKQPVSEQFPSGYLRAQEVDSRELKVGDKVYFSDYRFNISIEEIVGIGIDTVVNGTKVKGLPYTNLWGQGEPQNNINNYIQGKIRIVSDDGIKLISDVE